MARELLFKLNGKEYSFCPDKIERKKIYGWTDKVAFDDNGNVCSLVSMDESGTVIIPKGCIGMGILDSNMKWVERSQLMAVDEKGNEAELLPSSFSVNIELSDSVTPEEFLDYSIVSVYQLEDSSLATDFIEEIRNKIYTFNFNYREGYEGNTAFILENEGAGFILVGVKNDFAYIGLDEAGYIEEIDEEEEVDEGDIDFGMM